jgi:hypothetical protein
MKLSVTLRLLFVFAVASLLGGELRAAVTFTVSPSTVSNTYSGSINLTIAGLNTGESVIVQKFIDGNADGTIDGSDWLVQQFLLADGQASVIGGVTNFNVPGDSDTTSGKIQAQLSLQSGGIGQRFVGNYAIKLSSPTGRFASITKFLAVTNSSFAQSLTGKVVCGGTNVPNAAVLIFPGQMENSSPTAGVMANNAGSYTLKAASGTYSLLPFKPNFVTDAAASPTVTLSAGASISNNLSLLPAIRTISGRFVDTANQSLGLPGVLVVCESMDGKLAIGFTDTNGSFTVPVTASQWRISKDSEALPTLGYLDVQDSQVADTSTGSVAGVAVALPKGTALIYGSLKDGQDRPLPGVGLWVEDSLQATEANGTTDQNGNYVAAVVAGSWHISPDDSNPVLANYVVTRADEVTLSAGEAVQRNFRAIPAPNHVSGYVKNNGNNPVEGVVVYGRANLNGADYNQRGTTDANGYYSLNVPNGNWNVGLSCGGGDQTLSSLGYECVGEQSITIANNNGVVNFTVQPCSSLQVTTTSPLPGGQQNSFYSVQLQASGCNQPFTWSLAPGSLSLPPGLNLSPDGNLSGNPSASGTFPFTVRVMDNAGGSVNRMLSLTINPQLPPLQIMTSSLPNGTQNSFYSQQFTASGGQSPYSWWLPGGTVTLPPGTMSLASNGVLSGTPSASGTYTFEVGAYDNAQPQNMVTRLVSLSITPQMSPLQITTASLPNGTQNSYYSQQFTASGGQSPYTWWLPGGTVTLPPGTMSLTSNGVLSGTPSVSGTYNFWIGVFDNAQSQNVVTQMLSLTIRVNSGPTLGLVSRPSASQLQFQINGSAGQNYTIQTSTNLINWGQVRVTNAPSDSFSVLLNNATNNPAFYRILVGP